MTVEGDDHSHNLQRYFVTPSKEAVTSALEAWAWLDIANKKPIRITAFADVFFESCDGVWFLDTLEGKLKRICQTEKELDELLTTEAGMDHYLFSGFVDRAVREGGELAATQCYDFRIHPAVGGACDFSNVETRDFVVALHLRGQLHEQTRKLKPGTKISKFVFIDESKPKSKSMWKFW